MARTLKYLRVGLGLLLGLFVALAAAVYFIDLNEHRGLLAERISEATGRPLRIEGDVKLHLGWHTGFSVSDLSLANDTKADPASMASIGRLSFGLALRPLLAGRIEIDHLQIEDGEIRVERLPNGRLNWDLTQEDDPTPLLVPHIESLRLERVNLSYQDGDVVIELAVDEMTMAVHDVAAPADIRLRGKWHQKAIAVRGKIDNIEALLQGREVALNGQFEGIGAKATAKGRMFHPLQGRGIDLHISADATRMQDLLQAAGLEPFIEGAGKLTFDLTDRDGRLAAYDLRGTLAPAQGVKISATGQMTDLIALDGLDLRIEVTADDLADLSGLAGVDLPMLAPVHARGRVTGVIDQPALADLEMQAGREDRLLLTANGSIAAPLTAQGLDLSVRLQGPNSAVLSTYAGITVPALGRFDLAARVVGDGATPKLLDIEGEVRQEGGLQIDAEGAIDDPVNGDGLALQVEIAGPSLQSVAALAGIKTGDAGPFQMSGTLTGSTAEPAISNLQLESQSAKGTRLTVNGKIDRPLVAEGANLRFDVRGRGSDLLADLLALDFDLPHDLAASGGMIGSAQQFSLRNLNVKLGNNDLAGNMAVDLRGDEPVIDADLRSEFLDLSVLRPSTPEPAVKQTPATPERLIPDVRVDTSFLNILDGEARYQVGQLRHDDLLLENLDLHLSVKDGALAIPPSSATLADGKLRFDGALHGEELRLRLDLRRASLSILGPAIDFDLLDGDLDMVANVNGRGADVRAIAASLNGRASIVVVDGHAKNQFLDFLAKDLFVALFEGQTAKDGTRLHCLVNGYDIKDGIAHSQVLLVDTDKMTVVGQGQTDLRTEVIKYRFEPRPKDASLISLATPINVGGSLADPSFAPDSVAVAGSVAAAVVGNILLPGAGLLLPLLSSGTGETHPCMNVIKDGKAVPQPKAETTAKEKGGVLGRVGGAVKKGTGTLLKLPGKLLGQE